MYVCSAIFILFYDNSKTTNFDIWNFRKCWKYSEMFLQLNVLVNILISQYFQNSRCIIIYKNENNPLEFRSDLPKIVFGENDAEKWKKTFQYFGCQAYIIAANNPLKILEEFENGMKYTHERFCDRKYLIVPNSLNDTSGMQIFKWPGLKYIDDLTVISEENCQVEIIDEYDAILNNTECEFNLYTHKYVGLTEKENNEVILIDKWYSENETFEFNNYIYFDKISNQMGRVVKMATFNYQPYSIPSESPTISDGTEMNIALLYGKRVNVTLEYIIDNEGEWGDVYPNFTGTGIVGNVAMDKADAGYGALYTWEREYNYLDLSKPLLRTGITVLVPKPTLAGGWLTPFLSFNPTMWIAVFCSVLIPTIAIFTSNYFYCKRLSENERKPAAVKHSVMTVFALFLLQSVPSFLIPVEKIAKYVFSGTCVLALLLSSCYSSGLASSMTIPRYIGVIRTVEDLSHSGLYFGATSYAWINSITDDPNPMVQNIVSKFVMTNDSELLRLGKGRFGFTVERLPGGYFAIGDYIEYDNVINNLRLLSQDLYWENCVFMLKKSSVLTPSINKLILEINQAAFMPYWEFITVAKHADNRKQTALRFSIHHQEQRSFVSLTITHLEGAFLILFAGYGISIVIFVFEALFKRSIKH